MTKWILSFGLTVMGAWASAQDAIEAPEPIEPTVPSETVSTEVFQSVVEPGLARSLLEFPVYSFYLGAPDINGVAYVPNYSPRLGVHFSWKEVGFTITGALPLPKEEIDRRGNSDQFNVVFNRYWRQFGLDVYYQNYRGFYIASPWTELSIKKPERYPQLPDAEIRNYGINYYQVLNPDRYSMGASFSQNEIQTLSGGSWMITSFYNHLQMKRGDHFIPGSDPNSTQVIPNFESGKFDTFGVGGGYGHTWVKNKTYMTLQGIGGFGAQKQSIDDQLAGSLQENISAALKLNANAAIGYAPKHFVIGGKVLADALVSNVKNTQVYSTLINAQIFFGARF